METQIIYDESKIQTLSSLEHIRKRSGMYIGRIGNGKNYDDGIYILLKEVLDNSIDEFIEGYGKRIFINIQNGVVTCRDYGRGIPLGKVVDCVSKINTGGKFNDDIFQYSVGLNGVGTKAVNALSEFFIVSSIRDGKFAKANFEFGKLIQTETGETTEKNGTFISFKPDNSIFKDYYFEEKYLEKRVKYYTYLNRGLKIYLQDNKFESKNGLKDLLADEVDKELYPPIYHYDQKNRIEFAFLHTHNYGELYYSFVNGQYTNDGGTHQSAFREAILKAVNEFAKKNYDGRDVRDGIVGAISIKVKEPIFESQTKNKLSNSEIRSEIVSLIKTFLVDYFFKNENIFEALKTKIEANEKIRKELKSVRKEARELSRKTAIRIPKLRDCKFHFNDPPKQSQKDDWRGDESEVFLTEGDSAAGSMIESRDVFTQAIFALKGKPRNVYGMKKAAIYQNEEFFNIVKALNIEFGIDDLRYKRVVIATDSDPDGYHIRNLLITFFLQYFENLITKGHLYILETPLFRIRDKKRIVYCYNEKEKQYAIEQFKTTPEITRFKGLGEISPKEFGNFIGEDKKLTPVEIGKLKDVDNILNFYMGNNTPNRRKYVMANLDRVDENFS